MMWLRIEVTQVLVRAFVAIWNTHIKQSGDVASLSCAFSFLYFSSPIPIDQRPSLYSLSLFARSCTVVRCCTLSPVVLSAHINCHWVFVGFPGSQKKMGFQNFNFIHKKRRREERDIPVFIFFFDLLSLRGFQFCILSTVFFFSPLFGLSFSHFFSIFRFVSFLLLFFFLFFFLWKVKTI